MCVIGHRLPCEVVVAGSDAAALGQNGDVAVGEQPLEAQLDRRSVRDCLVDVAGKLRTGLTVHLLDEVQIARVRRTGNIAYDDAGSRRRTECGQAHGVNDAAPAKVVHVVVESVPVLRRAEIRVGLHEAGQRPIAVIVEGVDDLAVLRQRSVTVLEQRDDRAAAEVVDLLLQRIHRFLQAGNVRLAVADAIGVSGDVLAADRDAVTQAGKLCLHSCDTIPLRRLCRRDAVKDILVVVRVRRVGEVVHRIIHRLDRIGGRVLKLLQARQQRNHVLGDLFQRSRIAVGVLGGIQHIDGEGKHMEESMAANGHDESDRIPEW